MKSPDGLLAISLRVKARVFKTQGAWVFSLRESSARLRVFNPTKDSRAGLKKLSVCPRCRGVYSKPWVTSFRVQPYMSLLCPEYVASPSTIENFPFKHKSRFSSDQSYHTLSKGWWLRRVCILFFPMCMSVTQIKSLMECVFACVSRTWFQGTIMLVSVISIKDPHNFEFACLW